MDRLPHGLIATLAVFMMFFIYLAVEKKWWVLSADEFLRTLDAWKWTHSPDVSFHGFWLPFHRYLLGMGLLVWPDLFLAPRVMAFIVGMTALVFVYKAIRLVDGKNRFAPVLGVLLLGTHQLFFWLVFVSLTEIWMVCIVAAALYYTLRYALSGRVTHLIGAVIPLAVGCGIRYECWFLSFLWGTWIISLRHDPWVSVPRRLSLPVLAGLFAIPLLFPACWLLGNTMAYGNPAYFKEIIQSDFKSNPVFSQYFVGWSGVEIIIVELFKSSIFVITAMVWARKTIDDPMAKRLVRVSFLGGSLMFLATLLSVYRGYLPSSFIARVHANYIVLIIIPAALVLGRNIAVKGMPFILAMVLTVSTGALAAYWIRSIPRSDDSDMQAGFKVREYLSTHPGKVLLEKHYWSWPMIMAASNRPDRIILDREDTHHQEKPSAMAERFAESRDYLRDNHIGLVMVRSEELAELVSRQKDIHRYGQWGSFLAFSVK